MAINIISDPLEFAPKLWGSTSFVVPAIRNPLLDMTFDCLGADRLGVFDQGVLTIEPTISCVGNNALDWAEMAITPIISGTYLIDILTPESIVFVITPTISGDFYLAPPRDNWIAWSNIGNLDFEITKKNVAGEMPLDWAGLVSNIYKLGTRFVVAGENGVSFITPSNKFMGLNTLHRIGLLGRDAYAGNDFIHFFIDKTGCLYELGETLTKLDYKEFLSTLINPVLTFDNSTKILYMCDGINGYAYLPEFKSMGKCAPNITGIGYKNNELYVVAPGVISTEPGSIVTGIYDFGTRRRKTIRLIEVGADLTKEILVAIDYRLDKSEDFSSTDWKTVKKDGQAIIVCKGVEFRFKVKVNLYEDFNLEDLKIIAFAQAR